MRTRLPIAICGLFAAITVAQAASAQVALITKLRFGRHTNVTTGMPSPAARDTIMLNAASALLFDSGTDDVACNLTPQQLGFSNIFFNGSDIIDTQAQFVATRDTLSVFVNVVNLINKCGNTTGTLSGCATTGSRKPIVIAKAALGVSEAGLVVAHEFGHTQGLAHDTSAVAQIMEFPIFPDSKGVKNSTVCGTYRIPFTTTCPPNVNTTLPGVCSPSTSGFAPLVVSGAPKGVEAEGKVITDDDAELDLSDVAIEDLGRSIIVDRVPLEAELYYDQNDVRVLERMLGDQKNALYQRTIVALIGLISDGSPEDIAVLQEYAGQKDADVSAAMMALGYIANRTGSQVALDILGVAFKDPNERTSSDAILGLILSGDSEAAAQLQERAATETDRVRLARLDEAISENQRIAELGLLEHYRNPLPEEPIDPSLIERNVPEEVVDPADIE